VSKYSAESIWGTAPKRVTESMTNAFGSYKKGAKAAGNWKMPAEYRKAFDGRSNKIFGGMK